MPASTTTNRLDALTSMRFVAALLVVIFHITARAPFLAPAPFMLRGIVDGGFVWVGFFFILSGFILSYQYLDLVGSGRFDSREFWLARFARIYPGHLIGFLSVLFIVSMTERGWTGLMPPGRAVALADIGATLVLVHAWIPSFAFTFNFPSWSISTEAFFYLCFPSLALAASRWPLRRFMWFSGGIFGLAVLANLLYVDFELRGLVGEGSGLDPDRNFIKVFPLVRLPEFILGMAMGRLHAARDRLGLTSRTGERLAIIGASAVLAGLMFSQQIPFVVLHNVALSLPFAALTLGLALAPAGTLARWLSTPALVSLGEASYSVYILQAPILWVFLFRNEWVNSTNVGFAIAARVALLSSLIGVAMLSHRYIETPARYWIRHTLRRRVPIPANGH